MLSFLFSEHQQQQESNIMGPPPPSTTSTPPPHATVLPPDIIDTILTFNDPASIKTLSLLSRSFRHSAIRHLFASVHVFESPGSSFSSLTAPLVGPIAQVLVGSGSGSELGATKASKEGERRQLNLPRKGATPGDLKSFFERNPHVLPCVKRLNVHLDPAFFPWLWGVLKSPLGLGKGKGKSRSSDAIDEEASDDDVEEDDDEWSFLTLLSNLTTLQLYTPKDKIVAYHDLHAGLRKRLPLLYPNLEGLYISGIRDFALRDLERCERLSALAFSRVFWTVEWHGIGGGIPQVKGKGKGKGKEREVQRRSGPSTSASASVSKTSTALSHRTHTSRSSFHRPRLSYSSSLTPFSSLDADAESDVPSHPNALHYIHIDLCGAGPILEWLDSSPSAVDLGRAGSASVTPARTGPASLEQTWHVSIEMGDMWGGRYVREILGRVRERVEMLSFDMGRSKFYTYNLQNESYITNGPIQINLLPRRPPPPTSQNQPYSNTYPYPNTDGVATQPNSPTTPSSSPAIPSFHPSHIANPAPNPASYTTFPSLGLISFRRTSIHFNDTFSVPASPDFDDFEGGLNQVRGAGRLGRFYTSHVPEIVGVLRALGRSYLYRGRGHGGMTNGAHMGSAQPGRGNSIHLILINLEFDCFETDVGRVNWDDLVNILSPSSANYAFGHGMTSTGLRFEDGENDDDFVHPHHAHNTHNVHLPSAHAGALTPDSDLFPELQHVILRVGWSQRVRGVVRGGDEELVRLVRRAIEGMVELSPVSPVVRVRERERRRSMGSSVGGGLGAGSSMSGRRRGSGNSATASGGLTTHRGGIYEDDRDDASSEMDWEYSSDHCSSDIEVDYESINGTEGEGEGEGRTWSVEPMGGWDAYYDDVDECVEGGSGGCGGNQRRGRGRVGVDVPVGGEDVEFFLS
ncbi:hypothetical protein BJ165DRAFT_739929 [Panaeolus papilionaceus]|nr:hypothetical protein BJ165DRAFT_739929 [Panaeolus papilionaceus]